MTFLRPGFRAILPAAITAAVCGTILVAPPAGAAPMPMEVLSERDSGPARADVGSGPSDRFIVKFEEEAADVPGGKAYAYGRVAKELGISVRELRETAGGAVVVEAATQVSAESADSVVALLNAHPDVQHAEEDVLLHPLAAVNDPLYPQQWNLHEGTAGLRVSGAWDRSIGTGQTIAILDTGITAHSDLAPNVVPGYDFVADPAISLDGNGRDEDPTDPGDACLTPEPGTQPTDSSWHGTHVSGIAAAEGNNSRGVVGVAYGANLQPLRVMGACGGYLSDTIDAITWAAGGAVKGAPANHKPARIINMSLGSEGLCSPRLQEAIDLAMNRGSVVIAAAGNETQPVANVLPANCNNVITVGATDRAGNRASYSNYGPGVDVSAPGGQSPYGIGSTYNTGQTTPGSEAYAAMQGTSMAAPHVAGVAALMLSANPNLSPAQVEQILRSSARPLPGSCAGGCGTGIVDASAAVEGAATASETPFTDIANSPFREDIAWMYREGLTTGYTDGTYRPHLTIGREAMAAFLYRLAGRPEFPQPSAAPFTDVPVDHQFVREIAWMKATGLTLGYSDGTFKPRSSVNRDAMAAFLHRFSASYCNVGAARDYQASSASGFLDVTSTTKFYREISWMQDSGISTGWNSGDGRTYRPFAAVTRDAMAAFVHRMDTYGDANGGCLS